MTAKAEMAATQAERDGKAEMRRQELRQQEEPTAAKVERTMAKVEMTATQVPWSHLELLKLCKQRE